jgi:hypothetical protein
MKQLVQLLDECQAPSFGSKDVLLRRLVLLLQQQQQQQDSPDTYLDMPHHGHQQQGESVQAHVQQQQQQQQQMGFVSSRQLPEVAAQQGLLGAVLDVQQVGNWLLAARAQDVCIIDVRWVGDFGVLQGLELGRSVYRETPVAAWQGGSPSRQGCFIVQC